MKPYATRILGIVSLYPKPNSKDGKTTNIRCKIPKNINDGDEVSVIRCDCEISEHREYFCDDPRVLCIANRVWNLDLRGEYNDKDKIDEAIRIPTHGEALKYLHDREYTASCISDDMKNNYFRARPGWEDRMYQPD